VKYPHKQNIARAAARIASLMIAARVIIFIAKVLFGFDFESAGSCFR
jgi:hypothetical protein